MEKQAENGAENQVDTTTAQRTRSERRAVAEDAELRDRLRQFVGELLAEAMKRFRWDQDFRGKAAAEQMQRSDAMIEASDVFARCPRYRFTADEVMRMVEAGILREGKGPELIDGDLIEVSPQAPIHISLKDHLHRMLDRAYEPTGHVRDQGPLDLGAHTMPEPDLAVLRGSARDYRAAHPKGTDAILVVEIANTSQRYDRAKAALYACGGVPVYWLLDLVGERLERHEQPMSDGRYRQVTILTGTERVPVPGTELTWLVADLL